MSLDIKAGDIARHIPTGEKWIILRAGTDSDGDFVEPAGWPACRARMSDCDLIERGGGVDLIFNSKESSTGAT